MPLLVLRGPYLLIFKGPTIRLLALFPQAPSGERASTGGATNAAEAGALPFRTSVESLRFEISDEF